jgi:hypothetical protein
MGKLLKGINGPVSGKVGTVVGYLWHDMPVVRARPEKRKKPFTDKELNQQARFALMNQFLIPIKNLLNISFAHLAYRMNGFNKGFSYNVKAAIQGVRPDLSIDYSRVLLSRGDMTKPESVAVTATSPTNLQFTWMNNSGTGKALTTDQMFVAVFIPGKNYWFYKMNASTRKDENYVLDITTLTKDISVFYEGRLHCFMGLLAEDRRDASDSLYTGTVELSRTE